MDQNYKKKIGNVLGFMEPPFISAPQLNHESNPYSAVNGGGTAPIKRYKNPQPPLTIRPGHAAFRLLCHASRIGGVIGKSGSIIKQLQQENSAKIRIEDCPPSTDDRVITVVASSTVNRTLALLQEDSEYILEVSAAQEALLRVFERILNVAAEADGAYLAPGAIVSCRLLVGTSLVGSVIGKGGKVIERIRKDTGCKIRVLNGDKLSSCASPTDEIVEIEGDIMAIKKALIAVSGRLQDCLPSDKTRMGLGRPLGEFHLETLPDENMDLPPRRSSVIQPISLNSASHNLGGHYIASETDMVPSTDFRMSQQEMVFRILCPNDRVGGVIGKGGAIVRALQNESGASISVGAPVSDCDERLISITATESLESRQSPAQNAVVLVFSRFIEAGFEKGIDSPSTGHHVSARLLISPNQVGCLLGKGGSIISDMRKVTGAVIKILGGYQVPKCASENDQVVQMTGEFQNVQDALYSVTGRLRNNLLSSRMPHTHGAGTSGHSSAMTGISTYGLMDDAPSTGLQSSVADSHSFNQHTDLTKSMDNLSLSHSMDRPPSPRPWSSQMPRGINLRSGQDVGKGSASIKGGMELGSGNRSAIVTSTTIEILVPQNVIGSIYGENGSNLTQLRQISGAKVIIRDPQPGTSDQIVVISGTPDETQAAQSLLQAFIIAGQS